MVVIKKKPDHMERIFIVCCVGINFRSRLEFLALKRLWLLAVLIDTVLYDCNRNITGSVC